MTSRDVLPSAASLGLSRLVHLARIESTMEVAHALASEGADAGALIVADLQTRGRGRTGNPWVSGVGDGLWMTLVERPCDGDATGVLALRVGLALADALQPLVDEPVRLKWPNDVFGHGKLAGILVEARWRETMEWVAVGIGINMRVPTEYHTASAVRSDVSRASLLFATIPAIRRACAVTGPLSGAELDQWQRRDLARGRRIIGPRPGTVRGIAADGALLVADERGFVHSAYSGSLEFLDGVTP